MTAILGLNFHHADSSAALVIDGKLVAAVAEERLGRRLKHDPAFPAEAIRAVLAHASIGVGDLDYVAIPHDPAANRLAKARHVLAHPVSSFEAVQQHLRRANRELSTLEQVASACDCAPERVTARLIMVEHHLAHIASAYYCSPFESLTAGFSFDGSGDFVSAMSARCEGTKIEVLDRVHLPDSLGFFYTAACQFIGFDEFGEEYKVMGLAPYGEDQYSEFMQRAVELQGERFRLGEKFFVMPGGSESGELDERNRIKVPRLFTHAWEQVLGAPRIRGAEVTQREKDIARSTQNRFEEAAMHCFRELHRRVPTTQVVSAGGCALNGVANARVLRDTPFENQYLQAASADDGVSLGAAMWTWHNVAGGRERFHMHHAYWGPEHSAEAIRRAAEGAAMPMRRIPDARLPEVAARLIRAGLVTGWYQGRSEWGPRALGNRSILADPTQPQMKDLINAKIKRREMFRPFAPSIVRHAVATYFEQDVFSPFMMHVVKIRPQWRDKLPAITHHDGTGRLQSIERATNPLYFDLIEAFGRLSGIPIVLNTSFNENEPVVDSPEQALQCFLRTGLDAICLGNFVVVKPEHGAVLEAIESAGAREVGEPAVA
ncbi:MAG TPA: carbamoyltransferase C-terminal domain-containing protein [Dyella sp.]|uniref:carbamoyltransferase family protein n=1 Tax=Dyella sp. TaxID=1869338 RepID=UPI002D7A3F36|nr:carbamoyltransferase C-terminal domain-containing protein [Dyella sp.]HET6553602.1 carbamoyltransferase C-terminal domain-containing protein [Dyella sp.]